MEKSVKYFEEKWEQYKDNPKWDRTYRFEYKIIRKQRTRDYKKYPWVQVIRRIVEYSPATQERIDRVNAEEKAKLEAIQKREEEYEARRDARIAKGEKVFPRRW